MNVSGLIADVPAELTAVKDFITSVETLVNAAKAKSAVSVDLADLEALAPEGEALVTETEKVIADI